MPGKILLCDDEAHILRAAEFKFKRAGYEVFTANDGEEGWQIIQQQHPQVVITDCQMPRLDGLGLAERIHTDPKLSGLPVLMLTAKGFELPKDEICTKYGILAVVAKPFSPRDLLSRVDEIFASSSEQAPRPEQVNQ